LLARRNFLVRCAVTTVGLRGKADFSCVVRECEFTSLRPNNCLIVAPVGEDPRAQCIRPHGGAHWFLLVRFLPQINSATSQVRAIKPMYRSKQFGTRYS
jgi:hypothetical protein